MVRERLVYEAGEARLLWQKLGVRGAALQPQSPGAPGPSLVSPMTGRGGFHRVAPDGPTALIAPYLRRSGDNPGCARVWTWGWRRPFCWAMARVEPYLPGSAHPVVPPLWQGKDTVLGTGSGAHWAAAQMPCRWVQLQVSGPGPAVDRLQLTRATRTYADSRQPPHMQTGLVTLSGLK